MNKALRTYVRRISTIIMIVGIAVLLGWELNLTSLKSILPGLIAMNPFSALSFIAIAAWQLLYLTYVEHKTLIPSLLAATLALFVFLTGATIVLDELTASKYSFDDFFYTEQIGLSHMSQLTAFCFLMLGTAMMLTGLQLQRGNTLLLFIIPVFILSMISLFGYVIGNNHIETLKPFKPMALHSSICNLALITSFMLLFPKNSVMEILLRKDSGGYIARKLLPYVIVVPFIISYLRYQGEQLGLYDTGFGVAILMVSAILVFMFIIVRQSKALSEIDKYRREAEKKVEQRSWELEKANAELERRNKELEQFAYAASHDMQEPLRKIHSFSNFLLQHNLAQLDDKGKNYLGKINNSVNRMKMIIDDLLNYSHHTRDDDTFVCTDLNTVITTIESDLELMIREKNVVIIKSKLPVIKAVPSQMNQLFYNLITNALKFSKAGIQPEVKVTCKELDPSDVAKNIRLDKNKQHVHICVADNGIGFSQKYADQIFGLFKRLHGKHEYGGTGIGLALCKKVVENHRGIIWAESQPDEGATFNIILPVA